MSIEEIGKRLDAAEPFMDGVVIWLSLLAGVILYFSDQHAHAAANFAFGAFYRVTFHRLANRSATIHLHNRTGMSMDIEASE